MKEQDDELKSIKVTLDYYDENYKKTEKVFAIKLNKVKDVSESGIGWKKTMYSLSFSLQIPDHIHKNILGKTIPINSMGDRNAVQKYADDFSKTITGYTIQNVCERYWQVTQDYLWLNRIEKAKLKQVIFYRFDNDSSANKSSYNGLILGQKSALRFNHLIGYVSTGVDTPEPIRYNENKLIIDKHNNREVYEYKYVEWSESRQAFFDGIQQTFASIIDRINQFEKCITETDIDLLISNNLLLITN